MQRAGDAGRDRCGVPEARAILPRGYAVVGVAAVVSVEGGNCTSARVTVGGLTAPPVHAAVESLVGGPGSEEAIAAAAEKVPDSLPDRDRVTPTRRVSTAPTWRRCSRSARSRRRSSGPPDPLGHVELRQLDPELLEAREVVPGREDVDERQRRVHPARKRLVGWIALQRVEPDHAVGEP